MLCLYLYMVSEQHLKLLSSMCTCERYQKRMPILLNMHIGNCLLGEVKTSYMQFLSKKRTFRGVCRMKINAMDTLTISLFVSTKISEGNCFILINRHQFIR